MVSSWAVFGAWLSGLMGRKREIGNHFRVREVAKGKQKKKGDATIISEQMHTSSVYCSAPYVAGGRNGQGGKEDQIICGDPWKRIFMGHGKERANGKKIKKDKSSKNYAALPAEKRRLIGWFPSGREKRNDSSHNQV